MPRVSRICPRWDIRCPVRDSRLRATRPRPRPRRRNPRRRSSRQNARVKRRTRSDGEVSRYGGGGPLRPYTRSGGAPNCAPSLRSVAGLLGRSLAAAYEDPLRLPSGFVAKSVTFVAPSGRELLGWLRRCRGLVSHLCAGLTAHTSGSCAHVSRSHPKLCAGARRASLGKSVRKGTSAHTRGAERRYSYRSIEGDEGVLAGRGKRATRSPATERSEGAQLGAPSERV